MLSVKPGLYDQPLSILEVPPSALWPVLRHLARRRGVSLSEALPVLRVGDVAGMTRSELCHIYRMGRRRVAAWEAALRKVGTQLAGDEPVHTPTDTCL